MRGGRAGLIVACAVLAATASLPAAGAKGRPAPPPPPPSGLTFAGRHWFVRSNTVKQGPGPNYFSAANSYLDGSGNLHLRINRDSKRRWQAAEVFLDTSLGYGTYRFTVASDVSNLDRNVVLGLFTWSDLADQAHREIDVEVAKWGSTTDPTNAQFVVQPYDLPNHLVRYAQPAGTSVFEFVWSAGRVDFRSTSNGAPVASYTYQGTDVPTPGDEKVHLNLWLMNGLAPTNGQPVDLTISDFTYCATTC